jgi:carboxylesterase type B
MNAAWAAFARTGSPEDGLGVEWPSYEENSRQFMRFDTEAVGAITDPQSGSRKAWASLPDGG